MLQLCGSLPQTSDGPLAEQGAGGSSVYADFALVLAVSRTSCMFQTMQTKQLVLFRFL
jgi:hypothetical protein